MFRWQRALGLSGQRTSQDVRGRPAEEFALVCDRYPPGVRLSLRREPSLIGDQPDVLLPLFCQRPVSGPRGQNVVSITERAFAFTEGKATIRFTPLSPEPAASCTSLPRGPESFQEKRATR